MSEFYISANKCKSTTLNYTSSVEHSHSHCCTRIRLHQHVVNDGEYYYMEFFPIQKISSLITCQNGQLESFVTEGSPYGNTYSDHVSFMYGCHELYKQCST